MKNERESIFMGSLRAFLITLFGVLGFAVAVVALSFAVLGIASVVEEETYSSKVKILPDAQGNRTKLSLGVPLLLQITLDGEIGSEKLTAKNIEEILLETHEDALKGRVRGIILVINSPGGGVNDSHIIYRLLKDYKARYHIPIFAFVDGLCASGGYYIACAADKIYTSEVSLLGSIGVISWPPYMNVVDTLEKIGVSALTLSAGSGKDEMNPFRTWKPDEQKERQSLINFFYTQFVEIVSTNRPISKETLIKDLGAKVYPANEAVQLGLADENHATRSITIDLLATTAGIDGKYQVIGFETKSWWKKMLKEEPTSPLVTGKIKHELSFPSFKGNPFSYIFVP